MDVVSPRKYCLLLRVKHVNNTQKRLLLSLHDQNEMVRPFGLQQEKKEKKMEKEKMEQKIMEIEAQLQQEKKERKMEKEKMEQKIMLEIEAQLQQEKEERKIEQEKMKRELEVYRIKGNKMERLQKKQSKTIGQLQLQLYVYARQIDYHRVTTERVIEEAQANYARQCSEMENRYQQQLANIGAQHAQQVHDIVAHFNERLANLETVLIRVSCI